MIDQIITALNSTRFSLTNEKETQAQIEKVLKQLLSCAVEREVHLTSADIVDFMIDDKIAIEVKLRGTKKAIYAQLKRYAQSKKVYSIILVSGVTLGLPKEI